MAQVITNQDLNDPNKNKPQNQGQQNQSGQNQQQNAQSGNAQIAQNYNPNQQKGSGYTNIQRIVGANQANKLGQTIGQNIQQAGQKAQQGVTQAQQQFQQQAGANRADTAQNAQLVQQALQDPTQFINNPNQINQFQNLLGGVYQGPQGLQNANQLKAQAQDVSQLGQAIGSAGGRQGLLQRFVGTPQYSAGQQTLDSLLLGATGGKDLSAARRATTGIGKQEAQAEQGAAQTAQEYAQRAQQFGQGVQGQFGQNVAKQQQALTQQAQTAQQARDAQIANLQAQLGQGNLTKDIASQLGINAGDYTYSLDPSKFVAANPLQANAQNTANAQQYAQMQALQKLGGQFAPSQAQQTLSQFQNPSQAGSFQASRAYNVNAPEFQTQQKQAQESYQNYVNQVLNPAKANADQWRRFQGAEQAIGGNHAIDPRYAAALAAYQQTLAQANAQRGGQFNILPDEEK